MFKEGLIFQIINQTDHCQKEKEKSNWINEHKIGRKIIIEFSGLDEETYSYLKYDNNENKKGKDTKKCVLKSN